VGCPLPHRPKRFGIQVCDHCSRDFDSRAGGWACPWCCFDNSAGIELALRTDRAASRRGVVAAARRHLEQRSRFLDVRRDAFADQPWTAAYDPARV